VTQGGNAFHARAPVTGNAQSLSEDRRGRGRNHDVGAGCRTQPLEFVPLIDQFVYDALLEIR